MTITKDEFFKPGKKSAQDKASAIDFAARQIIATETELRAKKTEHLRQLREARDALAPPAPARKVAPARKK